MRKILVPVGVFLLFASMVTYSQQPAPKYYLNISNAANPVKGEVVERRYRDWIKVISFEQGVAMNVATEGLSASKPDFQELKIVKSVDLASSALELICSKGEALEKVELVCLKAGSLGTYVEFYKITLENARITSFKVKNDAEELPVEEVAFSYKKIKWEYNSVEPDGTTGVSTQGGWDVIRNTQQK
ncbi:MAG: type VI secretion system tube protein Hcp [Bacteroidota bacterium]